MSDFTDMLAADRDAVFLNTDEFAQTITRYPLGVVADAVSMVAIVILDKEPGTNQVDGDGVVPETRHGDRIRNSGTIWADIAVEIDDRDTLLIDGELYGVRRNESHDPAMQEWTIVRTTKITTRSTRLKF